MSPNQHAVEVRLKLGADAEIFELHDEGQLPGAFQSRIRCSAK